MKRWSSIGLALALSAAIFTVDLLPMFDGAIAVLYIGVVLLVAPLERRLVVLAGFGTALLAVTAFVIDHAFDTSDGASSRLAVSVLAIAITTLLSHRPGDETAFFEPFRSTKLDGMGMGLSIRRTIIENQNGRITAANNAAHGATVTFKLPGSDVAGAPAAS